MHLRASISLANSIQCSRGAYTKERRKSPMNTQLNQAAQIISISAGIAPVHASPPKHPRHSDGSYQSRSRIVTLSCPAHRITRCKNRLSLNCLPENRRWLDHSHSDHSPDVVSLLKVRLRDGLSPSRHSGLQAGRVIEMYYSCEHRGLSCEIPRLLVATDWHIAATGRASRRRTRAIKVLPVVEIGL